VADNDGYADNIGSPAKHEIAEYEYDQASFLWIMRMILILRDFNHVNRKLLQNWQASTSELDPTNIQWAYT